MQKSDVIRRSEKERTQVSSQALFASLPVRSSTTKALSGVLAWLQTNPCYGVSTEVEGLQYKSQLLRPGLWTQCKYSLNLV